MTHQPLAATLDPSALDSRTRRDLVRDGVALFDTLPSTLRRHYRYQELLASGAHGHVFAVQDLETGAPRALKVSHPLEEQTRALREVRVHAHLRHPDLLEVYDGGLLEGRTYLVLERARGSLVGLLDIPSRMPEAWRALEAVSRALRYLHAEGVTHRDVKPSNVLLTEGGARLSDLGLCRARGLPRITAEGLILGTPGYMAPEQARGETAGPPADVFALSVLAYQLLEGRLPFPGETPIDMVHAAARARIRPPRRARERVSSEALRLLLRGLDPDPGQRPESLAPLLGERPFAGRPLEARPASHPRATLTRAQLLEDGERRPSSPRARAGSALARRGLLLLLGALALALALAVATV